MKALVLQISLFFFIIFPAGAETECLERELRVWVEDPRGGGEWASAAMIQPDDPADVPAVINIAPAPGLNPLDGIIASDLCANGIATLLLEAYSQDFMQSVDAIDALEAQNRLSMRKLRKFVDALMNTPGIDPSRIGMLGSSLGGIFGAMYFPTDERLSAYVNILGAENIPEILTDSDNGQVTRFRERVMAREGIRTAEEFLEHAKARLTLDPSHVSTPQVRDKILQVLLDTDSTVPYRNQESLWIRSGRPERIFLQGGDHTRRYIDLVLYDFSPIVSFLARKLSIPRGREIIRTAAP